MASLQDQLMKAGIVDAKKAKKLKQEKRKQAKQQPKGKVQVNEVKLQAKQVLADKAARAKALNKQQQAEADKKAIQAQVIQLISRHRIDRNGGEIAYQFTDGTKIKKLYVSELLQNQLSKGLIAIAALNASYELVPAVVADKITERDDSAIVLLNDKSTEVDEDDPYADYQIPDDLMW